MAWCLGARDPARAWRPHVLGSTSSLHWRCHWVSASTGDCGGKPHRTSLQQACAGARGARHAQLGAVPAWGFAALPGLSQVGSGPTSALGAACPGSAERLPGKPTCRWALGTAGGRGSTLLGDQGGKSQRQTPAPRCIHPMRQRPCPRWARVPPPLRRRGGGRRSPMGIERRRPVVCRAVSACVRPTPSPRTARS